MNTQAILNATPKEADALKALAIGRLLRLGSRPTKVGDMKQYEDIRFIVMHAGEDNLEVIKNNFLQNR